MIDYILFKRGFNPSGHSDHLIQLQALLPVSCRSEELFVSSNRQVRLAPISRTLVCKSLLYGSYANHCKLIYKLCNGI